MKKSPFILPLVIILASSLSASAATIFIDFGPSGTANETTGGAQYWNNYTTNAPLALNDSDNISTGYTLSSNGTFLTLTTSTPPSSPYPANASRDLIYIGSRTLTLSNLDPSLTYSITLFGYVVRNGSRETNITIGGTTQSYEPSTLGGEGGSPITNPDGGTTTFSNLVPNASNQIEIHLSTALPEGVQNRNFILNTMEITSTIPEPSSSALLSSLALILGWHRRR